MAHNIQCPHILHNSLCVRSLCLGVKAMCAAKGLTGAIVVDWVSSEVLSPLDVTFVKGFEVQFGPLNTWGQLAAHVLEVQDVRSKTVKKHIGGVAYSITTVMAAPVDIMGKNYIALMGRTRSLSGEEVNLWEASMSMIDSMTGKELASLICDLQRWALVNI